MSVWSVRRRLGAFAFGLAAAFAAGLGVGALGSPIDRDEPARHVEEQHAPAPVASSTTVSPYAHQHDHFGGGG